MKLYLKVTTSMPIGGLLITRRDNVVIDYLALKKKNNQLTACNKKKNITAIP